MQTRIQALAELRFDLCGPPGAALFCVLQLLAPKKDCVYLATTCKQLYRLFLGNVQMACVQAMHKRLFKTTGQQQLYLCPTRTLRSVSLAVRRKDYNARILDCARLQAVQRTACCHHYFSDDIFESGGGLYSQRIGHKDAFFRRSLEPSESSSQIAQRIHSMLLDPLD